MRARNYLIIVTLIIFAAFTSGCCSFISDINSGSGEGAVGSIPLANGTHVALFDPDLKAGADAEFHVVSDHPVNLIIMDQDNFTKYYAAEQGAPAQWSAYALAINVTDGGLRFIAPKDGRYLFVIDNNQLINGSGTGLTTAEITANCSYKWSNYPFNLRYYGQ